MKHERAPRSISGDQLTTTLTSLVFSCTSLTLGFTLILILVYHSQGQNSSLLKNHFVISTIISLLIAMIFGTRIGYGSIKDKIQADVKAFETSVKEGYQKIIEENAKLNSRLETLGEENTSLQWRQYECCLARMYATDKKVAHRIRGNTTSKLTKNEGSLVQATDVLERRFEEIQKREELRKVISKFSSNNWNDLASFATIYALEKGSVKPVLDELPTYSLFIDLRLYLEAWLVSTISSDIPVNFPITDIGSTYPSSDQPEADVYKKAFKYLKRVFMNDKSGLETILRETHQNLAPEDIEVCKLLVPYIEDLEAKVIEFIHGKQDSKSSTP